MNRLAITLSVALLLSLGEAREPATLDVSGAAIDVEHWDQLEDRSVGIDTIINGVPETHIELAERGVKPFFVVDFLQELANRLMRLLQIPVFAAKNLFVFQRFHKRFASRVVPRIAFARHADADSVLFGKSV